MRDNAGSVISNYVVHFKSTYFLIEGSTHCSGKPDSTDSVLPKCIAPGSPCQLWTATSKTNHLLDSLLMRSQCLHWYRAQAIRRRTSKVKTSGEATLFEDAGRRCWAEIGFIRSQTCRDVGTLVTDARRTGNRVSGDSILPGSVFESLSHKIASHQSVRGPT